MNKLKTFFNENRVNIEKLSVIVLFFSFLYFFFNVIFTLIAPFIIGYFIAFFLEPIVRILMNKFKLKRGASAIISILLMIFVIGGSIFLIISQIVAQLKIFIANDPMYYFGLVKHSFENLLSFIPNIFFYIPEENMKVVNEILSGFSATILNVLTEQLKVFSLAFIKFIPKFFVYLIIGIISSFFFIKDKMLINNLYRNNMPSVVKKHITEIKSGLSGAFLGYLKSQSIIMCVTACISLIGLLIFGNDYALLVAFCIAIVDVLPLFGSGFILWPLSLVSFLSGDLKMGIGALVIYGIIQVTRQIIEPKILGSQIGIHPLVTLMSIYVGVIVFGVFGIVLGPMSAIIIKTIWTSNIVK